MTTPCYSSSQNTMAALATSLSHTLLVFQTASLTGFLSQQLHVAPELLESGLRLSGSCLEPHDTLFLSRYRHSEYNTWRVEWAESSLIPRSRFSRVGSGDEAVRGNFRNGDGTIYGCSPRESHNLRNGPREDNLLMQSLQMRSAETKVRGYSRVMEELMCKLESQDMEDSRKSVTRLQSMLRAERNPVLLGELVEFYFATRSKRAVKVLATLREAYSQVRPRSGTCRDGPTKTF